MTLDALGVIVFMLSLFSSVGEREDWFHTLSRAIADHAAGLCTFGGPCSEVGHTLYFFVEKEVISLFHKVYKNPESATRGRRLN